MGNLAKDLLAAKSLNTTRSFLCQIGKFTETLDEADRDALTKALLNNDVQLVAVYRALQQNGHDLSYDCLARHRRRVRGGQGCSCPVAI